MHLRVSFTKLESLTCQTKFNTVTLYVGRALRGEGRIQDDFPELEPTGRLELPPPAYKTGFLPLNYVGLA